MPHGANTINKKQNGTKPNQQIENKLQKKKVFPTPIENKANPKFYGF